MCSDKVSSNTTLAIKADKLTKVYPIFDKPFDRLKQYFWRNKRQFYKSFVALEGVSFELEHGDILGVVGRNGSGKSTLLQLICGTLNANSGSLTVNGRIAALLELGAGFNPEFSGRENVFLNASILGLEQEEIARRYDEIVEFSGIGEFIEQPVKTYSSGMYVRLAFSVAVCVEPDILIIDEALSVGDGAFARKSFEKIMELKRAGKTILFCSHSMYQIEALCNKAIWLEKGQVKLIAKPSEVVVAYNNFLEGMNHKNTMDMTSSDQSSKSQEEVSEITRFTKLKVLINGQSDNLVLNSQQSTLSVVAEFMSNTNYAAPSVGVAILDCDGKLVTSCTTHIDGHETQRDEQGRGKIRVDFPEIALLKGLYSIDVYLACENALHVYEHAMHVEEFEVVQQTLEQGVVSLPRSWSSI